VKDQHLKLRVSAGGRCLEGIGFNMAQRKDVPPLLDVAFSLETSRWNGRERLQLKLKDFREAVE
jgi:hypothetical protein